MISLAVTTLVAFLLLQATLVYRGLQRNIRAAKGSGLRYVISPYVDSTQITLEKIIVPLFAQCVMCCCKIFYCH